MNNQPNSTGQGQQTPSNSSSSGEQRPASFVGSIPRKSLPPTTAPPLPRQGQGTGYLSQSTMHAHKQHKAPRSFAEQPASRGPAPSLNAPIPRKSPPSNPSAPIPRKSPPSDPNAPIPRKSPPSDPNAPIPRKKPPPAAAASAAAAAAASVAQPPAARPARKATLSRVSVKSQDPFVIRIKAKGIPLDQGGIPRMRLSSRMPKRKRPSYEELRDTDSDDFMSDGSDDEEYGKRGGGRLQKSKPRASPSNDSFSSMNDVVMTDAVLGDGTDAPPPGFLSTLWYSGETFLNVFVLEKIIGWKTRPVVKLDYQNDIKMLDPIEAKSISNKLLLNENFWNDRMKRMEVSRTNAAQCPVVMAAAAAKEALKDNPRYSLAPRKEDEREEVLLVKWRGRSHLHCSWERRRDLEKFDPSNNTAKNKIRRYFQGQEIAMGKNWKEVVENERAANADAPDEGGDADDIEEEEFFPPQYLEVERILGCDETEMDMKVLAKQRALNIRKEQDTLRKREEDEAKLEDAAKSEEVLHHTHKSHRLFENLPKVSDGEDPWDPEDYVRYVVKWKGLQYAEMTWEYWKDIKRDAVDEAEDFWYRQRAPTLDQVNMITSRPHPHVRNFRKLTTSPTFAVSRKPRPVADLGDGTVSNGTDEQEETDASEGFKLRGYQLEGVNWLLFNWFNKRSCILADEMGLGKTIQSVAFLHQLIELPTTQVRGPFLIVAPLSLIAQWQSETHTWAPDMNVVFYHGSQEARAFLADQEFYYTDQFIPKAAAVKLQKKHITKFDILITTYEVVLKDVEVLSKIHWKALIVDEAHRLKNTKSRLFEELATVPRDFCILLTGTPLQNSTEELWALLNFSDPVTFGDKDAFVDKFGELKDAKQVSDLHSMLKPYLLRRVKEDVEKSLPPKEETILEVSLTPVQKKYYKAIYEKNTSFLFKGAKPSNAPSLMNVMMELRKCCNHPFLIRGVEDRILHDETERLKGQKDDNGNIVPIDYLKLFSDQLVNSSGKMVLLAKLLPKLFAGGHKVLIFSQMVRCLDLLEELMKIQHYKYERLDGSTTASARTAAVDRFHRKSCQRFVMLLSTRAGGLGLNLTAADVVIIFDSDWNPQNDLQAMARAHRIGQTRAVSVYRLLTTKTYEMHMFHAASMKLGLDRAVLAHQRQQETDDGEEAQSKSKSEREVQAKEIDELLKKGAYDVFRDDDDTEAKQFLESDIDSLLERSAKKVTYGDVNANSLSSGLGSFSKASFVADTGAGETDVDLDDPQFWEKAVGLQAPVEMPENVAHMIDDGVKRSRKQVQVFDPYAPFAEAEQKKKDRLEQRLKEEKEEKKRLRLERKQKKMEEKERRKREKQEGRNRPSDSSPEKDDEDGGKKSKESLSKKEKRAERRRALRKAENEDPVMERLKQAWEPSQRNRATSAALRFGFARFCKIRNESHLTSLPIQDLEVFFRSYVYQLSLQAAVTLLALLRSPANASANASGMVPIRSLLCQWLGQPGTNELEWVCSAVYSAIKMQLEVEDQRRSLRLPMTLAEATYVTELRQGAAIRALRRISLLSRLTTIVDNALDDVFSDLGQEEVGKRGCPSKDLTSLDADLKARHVTTEELTLALGSRLGVSRNDRDSPCAWWDRSCDVGLLVGSFIHGFGNYEAMRNDDDLPFKKRISMHVETNEACAAAHGCFVAATTAARKVFDVAFGTFKSKEQEKIKAAVYAASKGEQKDDNADAKNGGNDSSTPDLTMSAVDPSDTTHIVTLAKLSESMTEAVRASAARFSLAGAETEVVLSSAPSVSSGPAMNVDAVTDAKVVQAKVVGDRELPLHKRLPMPDSRVLDGLLARLIGHIEQDVSPVTNDVTNGMPGLQWEIGRDALLHERARSRALEKFVCLSEEEVTEERRDFTGIGFNGTQCASVHRSLDDGSDYSLGAASSALAQVATGTDAPRYLRSPGVPMNLTRYAASALMCADKATLDSMLSDEEKRVAANKAKVVDAEAECSTTVSATNAEVSNDKTQAIGGETKPPAPAEVDVSMGESQPSAPETAQSTDVADSSKEKPQSELLLPLVPPTFRDDAAVRAGLCATALHLGIPTARDGAASVDSALVAELSRHLSPSTATSPTSLLSLDTLRSEASGLMDGISMPPIDEVRQYYETVLLPHCLRLCVMGNGATTNNARCLDGKFETALGVSNYPDCSRSRQSPLPDPCATLADQSIEALACANAILRRVRLMRAVQFIASGGVPVAKLMEVLQSSAVRDSMDDLPVWWYPEIHDLGLLIHAASRGLFSVLVDRTENSTVFSPEMIKHHIQTRFIPAAQSRGMLDGATAADISSWIEQEASQFPSVNTLERRLGLLSSLATAHLGDNSYRYDSLPMWDHGAWPRK